MTGWLGRLQARTGPDLLQPSCNQHWFILGAGKERVEGLCLRGDGHRNSTITLGRQIRSDPERCNTGSENKGRRWRHLEAGSAYVEQQLKRKEAMPYQMEEEAEIMRVEDSFPSGGLCSLPGMCCQSEWLLSPYLPSQGDCKSSPAHLT